MDHVVVRTMKKTLIDCQNRCKSKKGLQNKPYRPQPEKLLFF
jgi:hypothetical protein